MLKNKDKKGQITWFVVVGFIVLVILMLIFFFASHIITNPLKQRTTEEIEISQAVEKVRSYVQSSLYYLAEEGVITLGRQGGLINLEKGYIMTSYSNISSLPEKEMLGRELSDYISQNLKEACVFEDNTFYTVWTSNRIITKTSFTENEIIIETTFPITVKAGNNTEKKLNNFKTVLPIRMDKIYDLAENVIEESETISYAENLEDMELSIYKEGNTKIYVLTDKKSKIRGKNYKFLFTNKKV